MELRLKKLKEDKERANKRILEAQIELRETQRLKEERNREN
jgi:hypothetical protein